MSLASETRVTVTDAKDFGQVAVLMGGNSAEREISLQSGEAVHAALLRRGVDAEAVDPGTDLAGQLTGGRFDRVWIALHGRFGEDGVVQGFLQAIDLPFTGSGVAGSAISMDKLRTKQLLSGCGIPSPAYAQVRSQEDLLIVANELGLPVMMKPAAEGSSLGLAKVTDKSALHDAYAAAAAYACDVFAEKWVTGPEYSASILQGEALPLIRIDTDNSFYDYDAKYSSGETRYICPCGLPPEVERRYSEVALASFRAVGATGWGRVDFMVDDADQPLILEVNTVPGMTSHSLVPMAAAQAGIDFDELVWRVLETSMVGVQ